MRRLLHHHALRRRLLHSLLVPHTLPFKHFLVQQRFNAYPARFGTEMPTKRICTSKASATAPLTSSLEVSFADKLLFARMQTLMPLTIMLASKCFPTNCAYKRSLIRVRPKVGPEVICSSEPLGTQSTLKSSRMLLNALCPSGSAFSLCARTIVVWICQPKCDNIIVYC